MGDKYPARNIKEKERHYFNNYFNKQSKFKLITKKKMVKAEDKVVTFHYKDSATICLTILLILFWGEPDLIDAIISFIERQ